MLAPVIPATSSSGRRHPDRTKPGRALRLGAVALGITALLLGATGCSSGDPDEPATIEATPATDLPAATDLADPDTVVPAGEWAVIEVPESAGSETRIPVAMKVTSVKRGEPGALEDVTSVTGNNELLKTGTPWFITVHWAALEGDGWDSPMQNVWGWNTQTDTSALNLSLPASQLQCAEPTTEGASGAKLEQVDCAAAMFEDSELALDQVRYVNATSYPGADNGIRFAVPTS